MYKDEMNVSGADLYSGLQKIFPDEKNLTLTERLDAADRSFRGIGKTGEISRGVRTGMPTGSGSRRLCCSRRESRQ